MQNISFVEEGGGGLPLRCFHGLAACNRCLVGRRPVRLAEEIVQSSFTVRGESLFDCIRSLAKDARDASAKSVRCVYTTGATDAIVSAVQRQCFFSSSSSDFLWIGLLDIFGFEDFTVNSFEQLCINCERDAAGSYNSFVFDKDMQVSCRGDRHSEHSMPRQHALFDDDWWTAGEFVFAVG